MTFKLERRVRLPGMDWSEYRLEADCRHFADITALCERRATDTERREVDHTGRQVQAEYRIVSTSSGDTLKTFIVGV